MKVLISAAEASSDIHGAKLLEAMRELEPTLESFGIGGVELKQAGLRIIEDARNLRAMGTSEVFGRLPRILSALERLTEALQNEKPDLVVVMDYPDFHLKFAKRVARLGIPLVYYIPPKVWVWRKGRAARLKSLCKKVLCIFPFEEDLLRQAGVDAVYVGNPLLDELPLNLTRAQAREKLGLDESETVLTLMPGSRPAELRRHITLMLDAAARAAEALDRRIDTLMAFPEIVDDAELAHFIAEIDAWRARNPQARIEIRPSRGEAHHCLIASDAALVKSGTSTLEAALLGCPLTVVYRASRLTTWLFKNVVRYRGPVGLVNLACGWKPGDRYLATELICENATVEKIAGEAVSLLSDSQRVKTMKEDLLRLRERLSAGVAGEGPSARAAREVIALVGRHGS